MSLSPILKALSSIRRNGVQALVMGGQACVLYGAAEFSRDLDLVIVAGKSNLELLQAALRELDAHPVAVPDLGLEVLAAGHAAHFRCNREGVAGLRIFIMSKLRGVDEFEKLWARRTTVSIEGETVELLGLDDLIRAKKTQRDKDWPMIRRLVERDYFEHRQAPGRDRVPFWLRELRTPEILVQVARRWPEEAATLSGSRPAIAAALEGDADTVALRIRQEEETERQRDCEYWGPLRQQLQEFRRRRRGQPRPE